MSMGRQLIGSRTMSQMRVHHHTDALELLEIAIDSRHVNVRGTSLDGCGKVLRGEVVLRVEEHLENDATPRC